jgi:YesN/AraC family two-component response regulator
VNLFSLRLFFFGADMIHVQVIIEDRLLLKKVYEYLKQYESLIIHVCPYGMNAVKQFSSIHAELVIIDSSIFLPYEKILNNFKQMPWNFQTIVIGPDIYATDNLESALNIKKNLAEIENQQVSKIISEENITSQFQYFHAKCESVLNLLLENNLFQVREEIQSLYNELSLKNKNVLLWEFVRIQFQFIAFLLHDIKISFNYSNITDELNGILSSGLISEVEYQSENIEENVCNCAKLIYQNWTQNIYIDQIADTLNHNKEYLNRIFTKQFKISISKAIHCMKIQQAKFYLIYTNKTAFEIGTLSGYNDNGYFTKDFKKITGFTPLAFREKKNLFMKNGITNSTLEERNKLYESIMAIQ